MDLWCLNPCCWLNSNWKSCLLLMGMQSGAATMPVTLVIHQKIKKWKHDMIQKSNSRNYSQDPEEVSALMFTAAIFTIAKVQEQPKSLVTIKWIRKCDWHLRWNIISVFSPKEGNPAIGKSMGDTGGRGAQWNTPSQKDRPCMIPPVWRAQHGQTQWKLRRNCGCQWPGQGPGKKKWGIANQERIFSVMQDELGLSSLDNNVSIDNNTELSIYKIYQERSHAKNF